MLTRSSSLLVVCIVGFSGCAPAAPRPPEVPVDEAPPPAAPKDQVCSEFSRTAVDLGLSRVTAVAFTTRATCVIADGALTCLDRFGSAPKELARKVVALSGGQRFAALRDDGQILLTPDRGATTLTLMPGVRDAVASMRPIGVTAFDKHLTIVGPNGEAKRFSLVVDGEREIAVAPGASLAGPVRSWTSTTLPAAECLLVGSTQRCRLSSAGTKIVERKLGVKAIGRNCALLEDDSIECFEASPEEPKSIGRISGAVAVAGPGSALGACAIDGERHVVCLGDLGPDFRYRGFSPFSAPRRVEGIEDAAQLTMSYDRGCALTREGRVRCFGCTRLHPSVEPLSRPSGFPTEVEAPFAK